MQKMTHKEALQLGIIGTNGLGFVKPKTAFKNVTEKLLAEIKKGNLVWRKPWQAGYEIKGKTYGVQNYETQRPYTGGNAFWLFVQNLFAGTKYTHYLTRKQINDRGYKLKPNSEPYFVSVYIETEKEKTTKREGKDETHIETQKGVIWYQIYAIEQLEVFEPIKRKKKNEDTYKEFISVDAETLVEHMPKKPEIKHGGKEAFYSPLRDFVQMPLKKSFKEAQFYYSVQFHELIHSTSHKKRLNRDISGKFGSKEYAFEELIAEIGAAYLCGVCNLDYHTVKNSAAYIKNWGSKLLTEISNDPSFLTRAVFKAAKAATFIIGTTIEKYGKTTSEVKEIANKPLIKKAPVKKPMVSDQAEVQKIKNSIAEAELILKSGKNHGRKLSAEEINNLKKHVEKLREKIGLVKPSGKEITPNKAIKASVQAAIEDVISVNPQLKRIGAMALAMLYGAEKNNSYPDSDDGLKGQIFSKLWDAGLVDYDTHYEINDDGRAVLEKIKARLDTLKAKKSGTDLFPELAGVKEPGLKFLTAYLNLHNKSVGIVDYVDVINDVQKAIRTGQIAKTHPLKNLINSSQLKLVNLYNTAEPGYNYKIVITNRAAIKKAIAKQMGLGFWAHIISAAAGKAVEYLAEKHLVKKEVALSGVNKKFPMKVGKIGRPLINNVDVPSGNIYLEKGNGKFGYEHIIKSHAHELKILNLSAENFAKWLCDNFTHIYYQPKTKTHLVVHDIGKPYALVMALKSKNSKNYFTIITEGARKSKELKKFQLVWKRTPSPVFPPTGLGSASMYDRLITSENHRGVLAPKQTEMSNDKSNLPNKINTSKSLTGIAEAGFISADKREQVKAPNVFRLGGEIGKFLQDIQRFKLAIALTGDPHAGKTEFVMQLANAFADIGDDVGAFMLEQGGMESKDTQAAIDRNINAENLKRIHVTGVAEKGIETVKKFANTFKVVIIDSWQKLNLPSTRFDELRQEFPNTIWIVIFQQNGDGGTRGGVSADYDTPILLKVHKVDDTRKNNWVELKKNRGNSLNVKYMMHTKKTIPLIETKPQKTK